jgi:hypothetical protein
MASIHSRLSRDIKQLHELVEISGNDAAKIIRGFDARFRANEKALFASEGSSGGGKWQALSSRYAKRKTRWRRTGHSVNIHRGARGKVVGRKIMQLTGRGRKSLATKNSDHIAGSVRQRWSVRFYVGSRVRYLAYHIDPAKAGGQNPVWNPRMSHRDTLQHTAAQIAGYYDFIRNTMAIKNARIVRAMEKMTALGARL